MLYSVPTHDHDTEEIERDHLTLYSATMIELWTRKREMRGEDENDWGDTSKYDKSGVQLA